MIFIINGRVKFNEYEGTLESVNAPHNMQPLAAATCRLLSIFVRNNEMLIKRQSSNTINTRLKPNKYH